MTYQLHQTAHTLLAAWAECGDNLVITESGCKRFEWDGQLAGIDAQTGQRATRTKNSESVFKSLRRSKGLDGHIDATSPRQPSNCIRDILLVVVDHDIRAHALGHSDPNRIGFHGDHQACAFEPCASGGT